MQIFQHYNNRRFYALLVDGAVEKEDTAREVVAYQCIASQKNFICDRSEFFAEVPCPKGNGLVKRFEPIDI